MTRELKQRWIEALRSGKYQQGTGRYRVGDCFCALGVLCDVYNPSLWMKTPNGCWDYPHNPITQLGSDIFVSLNIRRSIIMFNDVKQCPLPDIANWIEHNVATED